MLSKIFGILLSVSFSSFVLADQWISPIDNKYQAANFTLFEQLEAARSQLDIWKGEKDKLAEAYSILERVLKEDPLFAPALREMGRLTIKSAYINNANSDKQKLIAAEKLIKKAIEVEPLYEDAYVLLGHLYTAQGDYPAAVKALGQAAEQGSNSPWLHVNRADVFAKLGHKLLTVEFYKKAIAMEPSDSKAYSAALSGLARYYRNEKNFAEAEAWFQKLLALEPNNAWIWGNYASYLLFDKGDYDQAISNGEKSLAIRDYPVGRYNVAMAYLTKWAGLLEEGYAPAQVQSYYDHAERLYPNLKELAVDAANYESTMIVARHLGQS